MTNEQIAVELTKSVLPIVCQKANNFDGNSIAELCVKQYQAVLNKLNESDKSNDTKPKRIAKGFSIG